MEWSFVFFLNSALLGVGLAMDAFSVSMANGLHDPRMSRGTMCKIAGTFALFQAVMPMTGWVCVHTIVEMFSSFETFIPWIALALLGYIGGKMLVDGIRGEEAAEAALVWRSLFPGCCNRADLVTSCAERRRGFKVSCLLQNASPPGMFSFACQKRTRKAPATFEAREARIKGCSPLIIPKLLGSIQKIQAAALKDFLCSADLKPLSRCATAPPSGSKRTRKLCCLTRNFAVMPRALPLGELARSD